MRQDLYAAFKAYPGRLNQASKDFVANVDAGKTYPHAGAKNDQAHCMVKVRASCTLRLSHKSSFGRNLAANVLLLPQQKGVLGGLDSTLLRMRRASR